MLWWWLLGFFGSGCGGGDGVSGCGVVEDG